MHFEPFDLRDIDALCCTFAALKRRVGMAEVLVNNAARDDPHLWDAVTPEYYDEGISANLRLAGPVRLPKGSKRRVPRNQLQ